MIARLTVLLLMLAQPLAALELALPPLARITAERHTGPDRFAAPVGAYGGGVVPRVVIDGAVRRTAWRLEQPGVTPFQLISPLRAQLENSGYRIVLDCAAEECGGFDFRFAVETLPGPSMYVNIRFYHYVTGVLADASGAPERAVAILASANNATGYVQIIEAGKLPKGGAKISTTGRIAPAVLSAPNDLSGTLLETGHVVLSDLEFETGSSDLGAGPFASLGALAEFLDQAPDVRIAVVGHTDSVGGLAGNIELSKRRARAVRDRLVETYDIPIEKMQAEGMGYLAPVASNLNAAGREANRRVEVILLSN